MDEQFLLDRGCPWVDACCTYVLLGYTQKTADISDAYISKNSLEWLIAIEVSNVICDFQVNCPLKKTYKT